MEADVYHGWIEASVCEKKNRAGKGPGRNLHVTHSIAGSNFSGMLS